MSWREGQPRDLVMPGRVGPSSAGVAEARPSGRMRLLAAREGAPCSQIREMERWRAGSKAGYEHGVGYRLILFDFDGTLANSVPWLTGVVGELAEEFGFRPPGAAEVARLRESGPLESMALLGVPSWKIPLIAARLRRRMAQELHTIRPFDGVAEMLRRLGAAGVELAVVTSNTLANAQRVLKGNGGEVVSHWACGAALLGKAIRFRKVLARAAVPAQDALCVGDELRDARAARAAGIPFGAVGWGYNTLDALRAEGPREVFERVEDLGRLAPPRTGP